MCREKSRLKAVVQAQSQNKPLALLNCDCTKLSERAAEAIVHIDEAVLQLQWQCSRRLDEANTCIVWGHAV